MPDTLIYEGFEYDLCDEPLQKFVDHHFPGLPGLFEMDSVPCWRGYEATLEIKDGKLYLKRLSVYLGAFLDTPFASLRMHLSWEAEKVRRIYGDYIFHCDELLPRPKNGREACENLMAKAEDDGLFANWFSGKLRCLYGKLMPHISTPNTIQDELVIKNKGFSIDLGGGGRTAKILENKDHELIVTIDHGVVVSDKVRNRVPSRFPW